jgi:L-ascorbate metabolism protein UlaG (beta-lactamase superfamily)
MFNRRIVWIMLSTILTGCLASKSMDKWPISNHFNGKTFFNPGPEHTFSDMLRWMWQMKTIKWPKWIDDEKQTLPPERVGKGQLKVTYINHSTVLIQVDSINILTDPIFSKRAGPFSWLGVKRIRKPGILLNELPAIDYILVSHNHYDHLDLPSLKALRKKNNSTVLTGLGNKRLIQSAGFTNIFVMDWWQIQQSVSGNMQFIFVPAVHESGRGLFDKNKTLWGGFVIITSKGNIYFAGDTGYGGFIEAIHSHFDAFELAFLPIGNYEVRWFMKNQHMNPDDAVKTHIALKCKQSIGIHYATFAEHPEQPVDAHERDLKKALEKYLLPDSIFHILKFGESLDL